MVWKRKRVEVTDKPITYTHNDTHAHTPLYSCSLTRRSALAERGCVFVCRTLYCVKAASVPISPLDGETERPWVKRLAVYQNAPLECCAERLSICFLLLFYYYILKYQIQVQELKICFLWEVGQSCFFHFVCVCFIQCERQAFFEFLTMFKMTKVIDTHW